jgi:hypothetical protein
MKAFDVDVVPFMVLPPQSHPVKRRGHAGRPGDGPQGETCGTCFFYTSIQSGARSHPRCLRMRAQWTGGSATDIRRKDPACKMWEEPLQSMIVKIQRPITPPEAPAMIYDERRLHTEYRQLGKRDLKVMGSDMKVYRQAKWTGHKWKLGDRVVAQRW